MNCADCFWCKVKIPILDGGYLSYETAKVGCKKGHWKHSGSNRARELRYLSNNVAVGESRRTDLILLKLAKTCLDFQKGG